MRNVLAREPADEQTPTIAFPRNRWDRIWKLFCDVRKPHGVYFLRRLLGADYADYDVEGAETSSVNTDGSDALNQNYADAIIKVTVDNVDKLIHLEFQSAHSDQMGLRMLSYAIAHHGDNHGTTSNREVYDIPTGYIIDVRGSMFHQDTRSIVLRSQKFSVEMEFPVVHVLEVLPEVDEIMKCRDLDTLVGLVFSFANSIPGMQGQGETIREFATACYMLTDPAIFKPEGTKKGVSKEFMSKFENDGLTITQRAEKKGEQKGYHKGYDTAILKSARTMAKCMGKSVEEALRLLQADDDDDGGETTTAPGRLSRMNLS